MIVKNKKLTAREKKEFSKRILELLKELDSE